jgi:hypothetical protein
MDKVENAERKAYSRPTMVRVKLNPEQAVLGACSSSGSGLSNNNNGGACIPAACRKSNRFQGADGGAGS